MIEKFIERSLAVGTKNHIIKEKDLLQMDFSKYSYINLPGFSMKKEMDIPKSGIEYALVEADFGICETGSVVIDSYDLNLRKATCLAENLHIVLLKSRIVVALDGIASYLKMATKQNSYIAFVTGASRTADIERVLTIGVHGPLSNEVFIIEDK